MKTYSEDYTAWLIYRYLTNSKDWFISYEWARYYYLRRIAVENYGLNEWDFEDDY